MYAYPLQIHTELSVVRPSIRPSQGWAVRPSSVRLSVTNSHGDREKKRPLSLCPFRPSVTRVGSPSVVRPSVRYKFTRWSTVRDDKYLLELPWQCRRSFRGSPCWIDTSLIWFLLHRTLFNDRVRQTDWELQTLCTGKAGVPRLNRDAGSLFRPLN